MDELEEIRKKRMEELQQRCVQEAMQQNQQEAQIQQQLQQIEGIIKQKMSKEALQRYSNIKAADPEKAAQLSLIMAQFLQTGKLNKIDDETLKQILIKVTPKKRKINIKRK